MATANRTLQYSTFNACSCVGVTTYTPGFDIRALNIALGTTGTRPLYMSLAGTATTSSWALSTGGSVWWPSLPSPTSAVSVTCTTSGAEFNLSLFG